MRPFFRGGGELRVPGEVGALDGGLLGDCLSGLVVDFERFVLRGGDSGGGLGVVLGLLVRSGFGVFVRGGKGLLDRHGWRKRREN